MLFEPHLDSPIPVDAATGANAAAASVKSIQSPIKWWKTQEREQEVEADWVRDFSSSYILHAYSNRISAIENFTGITVPYVFSRQSNFARAVYPAAKHALDRGLFTIDD